MKKLVCLMAAAALVLLAGSAVWAQPKAGLDLHGIYGFNYSDDDQELEKGWGGGASLVLCLGEFVKLDLGGDYIRPEIKDMKDSYVQMIPVAGTLRIGGNLDIIYLYVGGGAGYSFNDLDLDDSAMEDAVDLEDCFTYHACGGAEIFFSPQIALRGEFRYVWMEPELKVKATGDKEDWNMNHMQARAGINLYF